MIFGNKLRKYLNLRSKSMQLKIFLSLTAISLMVIILLGIYTYYFTSERINNKIEAYQQKKLSETINKIDIFFEEMLSFSRSYQSNSGFMQFMLDSGNMFSDKYKVTRTNVDTLKGITSSNNSIKGIFIYYSTSGYTLGNNGLVKSTFFPDKEWKKIFDKMVAEYYIMDTRPLPVDRPIKNTFGQNNVFTLITGIPYSIGMKQGAVVLYLDSKLISDLLIGISDKDSNSNAFLVNRQGVIISSSNKDNLYKNITEFVNMPSEIQTMKNSKFRYSFKNKKMTGFFDTTNFNQWKLVYALPDYILYNDSYTFKNITLDAILLLLLLSTITSLFFTFKVYNPIKIIITNLKSMVHINDESISDIKTIENGLNLLLENNKYLEDQMNQNKMQVKEAFVNNLITGKLFNKNEIRNKAEYFQINLECEFYKVAVIQWNMSPIEPSSINEYELKKVAMLNIIKNMFENFKIDILDSQDSNDNIVVLIKLQKFDSMKEIEGLIESALEDIIFDVKKYLELNINIGVGEMYEDLANISVSFKEAVEALQYKFIKERQSVIYIRDIHDKIDYELFYPHDKEQQLVSLVKSLEYDKVVICLNSMIDIIMSRNKTFEHIEISLINIIGVVQRCIFELNLNQEEVFNEKHLKNVKIDQFANIQQYIEWVSISFRKIIEYKIKIELEKSSNNSFTSDVKNFIENRYMDNISLDMISTHFKYNPSYLSRVFKEKTGKSLWDYLAEVRIMRSEKLLIETEKSIDEIFNLVGYNNRSSYARAFKKYTNLTPGQYRLKNKEL